MFCLSTCLSSLPFLVTLMYILRNALTINKLELNVCIWWKKGYLFLSKSKLVVCFPKFNLQIHLSDESLQLQLDFLVIQSETDANFLMVQCFLISHFKNSDPNPSESSVETPCIVYFEIKIKQNLCKVTGYTVTQNMKHFYCKRKFKRIQHI